MLQSVMEDANGHGVHFRSSEHQQGLVCLSYLNIHGLANSTVSTSKLSAFPCLSTASSIPHSDALQDCHCLINSSPDKCKGFLRRYDIQFISHRTPTPKAPNLSSFILLLTQKALAWVTAIWKHDSPDSTLYECLLFLLQLTFDPIPDGTEVDERLLSTCQ